MSSIQKELLEKIAVWVAGTNQALTAVNNPLYRDTMASAVLLTKPMNHDNIKDEIIRLNDVICKKVITKMEGCAVNLTIDHWTSKQNFNYTGMTAHWVDKNRELNSIPLGMFLHKGKTRSVDIIDNIFVETA